MQISKLNKLLYLILSLTIFIGLFLNEDSSGSGGFIIDFNSTFPLVKNPFQAAMFNGEIDFKFPLHYYFSSLIYFFTKNEFYLRFVFCLFSLSCPFLFYLCLKEKYSDIDKNNLFVFSLILFIMPSFRSGAIWANTQITAIIFFLFALYFFLKWESKNIRTINANLIFTLLFLSFAVYTRQLYSIVYLYFLYLFFIKFSLKDFLKICLVIFVLAIPGLILTLLYSDILTTMYSFNFYNTLLINSSIISFYLIPFYLIFLFVNLKKVAINKYIIPFLAILTFVIIATFYFDYNFRNGGGFFIKASVILFNNLYLFYLSSFIGLFLIYLIALEDKKTLLLSLLLLFGFSTLHIYQKYFEPMFLILFFLVYEIKLTRLFLKNKKYIVIISLYFLVYFLLALTNNFYLITKKYI